MTIGTSVAGTAPATTLVETDSLAGLTTGSPGGAVVTRDARPGRFPLSITTAMPASGSSSGVRNGRRAVHCKAFLPTAISVGTPVPCGTSTGTINGMIALFISVVTL